MFTSDQLEIILTKGLIAIDYKNFTDIEITRDINKIYIKKDGEIINTLTVDFGEEN